MGLRPEVLGRHRPAWVSFATCVSSRAASPSSITSVRARPKSPHLDGTGGKTANEGALTSRVLTVLGNRLPLDGRLRPGCVLMSWLAAILSAMVYDYHISVPFHMVFKSSILLVNMTIGVLVLKRRYVASGGAPPRSHWPSRRFLTRVRTRGRWRGPCRPAGRYSLGQVASVLLVTAGVMLSTYASLPKQVRSLACGAALLAVQTCRGLRRRAGPATRVRMRPQAISGVVDADALSSSDYGRWLLGVAILALSLVFTGFLGILQDLSYRKFGQHWQEALFYAVRGATV